MADRETLCMSSAEPGVAIHSGDPGFKQALNEHVPAAESKAIEQLIQLKSDLKVADTDTFWNRLMEGLTGICKAQFGFVGKRMLVDDQDSAVEMPPLGETGSCLMGVAMYYNDGKGLHAMHRDYKFMAWACPCAYMRHDKVFLVPEHLSLFCPNNPNESPFPLEGYLAVPLFSEGKCFAHFGLLWSEEGLEKRDVSWGVLELVLHSLEDMLAERLLTGRGFGKKPVPKSKPFKPETPMVIPQHAITVAQSLKPYARSLSHELRTPMQGVVGMLDVMHATVQEAIEGQSNDKIRRIFQTLRENIEIVQDSSKRAVEAADNVVHAYDMNMQVPETPQYEIDSPFRTLSNVVAYGNRAQHPNLIESFNPHKRRRSSPNDSWQFGNPPKLRNVEGSPRRPVSPRSCEVTSDITQSNTLNGHNDGHTEAAQASVEKSHRRASSSKLAIDPDALPTSGHGLRSIRALIPEVIQDSLRSGGRPDSAIAESTELGEKIEVRTRSSSGIVSQKIIVWSVDESIPDTLQIDERDLAKLMSAVFLNAVKFTENGTINLSLKHSPSKKYILIHVLDTGDGIPEDFKSELFKPFSREDDSLTRSREGLGLGLLVAKGLARRLGGDLTLIRSQTSGANKGSEFEIKVPMEPVEGASRATTPHTSSPEPPGRHSQTATGVGSRSSYKTPTPSSPLVPPSFPRESVRTPTITALFDKDDLTGTPTRRGSTTIAPKSKAQDLYDRELGKKHPLRFLVAEDNKINRKLLVNMLGKFGYKEVYEAFDGREAVRIMNDLFNTRNCRTAVGGPKGSRNGVVDVILMDLWMPEMDGYEATERILQMFRNDLLEVPAPVVLAVSADVTDEAIARATKSGMEGYMTKPYKLADLQRLIRSFCIKDNGHIE